MWFRTTLATDLAPRRSLFRSRTLHSIRTPSPIYVLVKNGDGGTNKDSYILCDRIRTVDQRRFKRIYGTISAETMALVDKALLVSLGLQGQSS